MKRLLQITTLTMLLAGLYSGCKKDSSTKSTTSTSSVSIIGKWNYISDTVRMYKDGKITSDGPYTYPAGNYSQFDPHGTGNNNYTTFTYSITGKILTVNYAPYKYDGITYEAETETAEIRLLTDHKIYLFYDSTTKDDQGRLNGNSVAENWTR